MAELISSIGWFFVYFISNPLWYIGFIVIYILSARRVKREREAFHTRVYAQITDWTIPFLPALLAGIFVSITTVGLGIVLSKEFILLLVSFYLLSVLTFQIRWMTPTFVIGAILLFYGCKPLLANVDFFIPIYEGLSSIPMYMLAGLLALFLIVEGVLIRTNGVKHSSPSLERSKRGKWIGSHESKRLWIIPVLFFIPEGVIPSSSYWPMFPIGDGGWQPILLPFFIGFKQQVQATLPYFPIRKMGGQVIGIGLLFIAFVIGSYYIPFLAILLGGLAIVSRELLWVFMKKRDENQKALFVTQPKGCIVLGVLPNSPAEKMNIVIGETIIKVNGQAVNSEESFYEALQLNSAFCKLDILNLEGEIRFAQGALYDGEHHQIGVLLIKDDTPLQDSII